METSYRRRVGVPARGPARDGDPGRDGELPMEEEEEEEEEGGGFLARFGAPVVRTPRACRRGEPRLVPWGMHRGFRHGMPRAMSGVRSRRRVLLHAACEAKCCSTRRDRSGHGLLTTGKYRGQGDESSSARVVLKVLPRKEFGFVFHHSSWGVPGWQPQTSGPWEGIRSDTSRSDPCSVAMKISRALAAFVLAGASPQPLRATVESRVELGPEKPGKPNTYATRGRSNPS